MSKLLGKARSSAALTLASLAVATETAASSLNFVQNTSGNHEYGVQTSLPTNFGAGEFTFELWLRPDNSKPIDVIIEDTPGQLRDWSSGDAEPYSSNGWWWRGNFLLDGHNNNDFSDGTFSLQFYGGGRVRWDFGDGAFAGNGGHWAVQAYPATDAPTLLDGGWHQVTCVRRWSGMNSATLELWVDGALIGTENSNQRTNMWTNYWSNWSGFPSGQAGWFWGSEKQAAIGVLSQYEDYKGLVDEIRYWSRAKTTQELTNDWDAEVTGAESGLIGWYRFSEGSGTSTCNSIVASSNCISLVLTNSTHWSSQDAPVGGGPPGPGTYYVNFSAAPGGNGSQGSPFNTLTEGLGVTPPSTLVIAPGTTSEAPTIASAFALTNGNAAGGAVRIGVLGARSASSLPLARTGFISIRD